MTDLHFPTKAARHPRLRPLALALVCLGLAPALAQTLPSGFAPAAGTVGAATTAPGVMTITQGSARAIANWNNFSIGAGGTVNVVQPGAASILLNRVVTNTPSAIDGALNANGHVFLVNPFGITFSKGSSVSVGGLVASTLDIDNAAFMGGSTQFKFTRTADSAGVVNRGSIVAADGGTVALLGATARNEGSINVARGSAGLVSGGSVTVDFNGDGITTFTIPADSKATQALVENAAAGSITADGGRITLLAASDAAAQVVNQSGVLRAQTVSERNGQIVLGATGVDAAGTAVNELRIAGQIDASGGAAGRGGVVTGVAGRLRVDGAAIDASGSSGGTVQLIGINGVALSPGATLRADGRNGGDGGTLGLVSTAGGAQVYGALSARGGEGNAPGISGGSGGTIRTQGTMLWVGEGASIDAGGGAGGGIPVGSTTGAGGRGANGRWTAASAVDVNVESTAPAYGTASYDNGGASVVRAAVLGDTLGKGTDVTLASGAAAASERSDGVGVVFGFDATVRKAQGPDATFTVNSARSIAMRSGAAIESAAGALNVDFNADANGTLPSGPPPIVNGASADAAGGAISMQEARIETNGGSVRFYGQGNTAEGRATGTFHNVDAQFDGIALFDSTVSTCAIAQGACATGGGISLRGRGISGLITDNVGVSGNGVRIEGTQLRSGSGNITLDGQGALLASGVRVARYFPEGPTVDSRIGSGSGDIVLTGSTRSFASGDRVGLYLSPDVGGGDGNEIGGGAGVLLDTVALAAGGSIRIDGIGGTLDALATNNTFANLATGESGEGTLAASHGVRSDFTAMTAGAGQQIAIAGTAGSREYTYVDNDGAVVTPSTLDAFGVRVFGGAGSALRAEAGSIEITGRNSDVAIGYQGTIVVSPGDLSSLRAALPPGTPSATGSGALLDVSSATLGGGDMAVSGRNVAALLAGTTTGPMFDARGAGQGGSITLRATADAATGGGVVSVGQGVDMAADANTAVGSGGSIRILSDNGIRVGSALSARGGAAGGDGGLVETSGGAFELDGIRVDASAPAGKAGTWLVDPFDVVIASGTGTNTPPANPFDPPTDSTILDGDINYALNNGTSVHITTGTGGTSPGNITFRAATIDRTAGANAQSFRLDAARDILMDGQSVIRSNAGPLDVIFNAGLNGTAGSVVQAGPIATNGGSVTMNARGGTNVCAICVSGEIDTRIGQSDANAGGSITLTVPAPGDAPADFNSRAAIAVVEADLFASTGNVALSGVSQTSSGVLVQRGGDSGGGIFTTSGNITLTGIGSYSTSSTDLPANGVTIDAATLQSVGGNIAVRGRRNAGGPDPGAGVALVNNALVTTLGTGSIEVTGEHAGNGAGVFIADRQVPGDGAPIFEAAGRIDGNDNVVLRAANDGSTDALVLGGAGTVRAGNVLNLRPGGVDAAGVAADRTAARITLGGTAATGFAVSADEIARMSAATTVVGSDAHAGGIDVVAPLASATPLTLQSGGGGNIALGGAISAPVLGLLAGGDITQAAGAAITAGTLLARSSGGNVLLGEANHVSDHTLGGGAAGRFEFVNGEALRIGNVEVTGFSAAGNAPQTASATSMAADAVFVRTLGGSLTLATGVSGGTSTDLVAASTFQNAGGSIGGAPWRVWADTWVGETRGGLAGSGPLPNLYHCAYAGLCTVTVSPADNHFIYAQQPSASVVVANASRLVGAANPPFAYTLSGLILGDAGNGFAGSLSSDANTASPPGSYPINGSFTSAEGYLVSVVPGTLVVNAPVVVAPPPPPPPPVPPPPPAPRVFVPLQAPLPDVVRETPATWLYDRNIGPAPICLATGPLDGDRPADGGDVLAREWSRVRDRPNLTNCIDTQRRNSCGDF